MMNLNRGELRGQCILQAASFEQLWRPYQQIGPKYPDEFVGLSWFIDTYRGRRRIRHDGVDTGFQSDLILLPEESIAVIALANTIPAPMNMLMNAIVDVLLGLEPELPKPRALLSLAPILSEQGVPAAVDRYRHLQETQADQYDFGVEQFLDIGYTLLEVRRYDECFRMAQLALKLFPDSPDIVDLLTQLRERTGQT
jgi:hypothetical protein